MDSVDISTTAENIVDSILHGNKTEDYEADWTLGVNNSDRIGEKIAAFATSGGGWLVIGLEDKTRKLFDIGDEQILITKVGEILRSCSPIPQLGNPFFVVREGKKLAVYRIPGFGGTLCDYRGSPYHRVQDSAKKMTTPEVREYLQRYGVTPWEYRPSTAPIEAIDKEELAFYLKNTDERFPTDQQTEENYLKMNRAVTGDGRYLTNLGLIVLGKKPDAYLPQCKIQLIRFKGTEPVDRIASNLLSLPSRKIIDLSLNFIILNLPSREYFRGAERIEEPIIPLKALREAVVNMVVHRDYNDTQESLIRIFDDRIEFQNPGAPDKTELLKILSQCIPSHRNQGIYNFLRPVHKAEAAGQGIPIMKKEMSKVGLTPPDITILSNLFHLTLRFEARKPETLEDVVLLYIREKKTVTTSDVMRIYHISRPTAIKILNELVRKEQVHHTGRRRASEYHSRL